MTLAFIATPPRGRCPVCFPPSQRVHSRYQRRFADLPLASITVVNRDRSDLYANGITQGAPRAVQVVERFHLVANLREALEACCLAHLAALKQAAAHTAQAVAPSVEPVPITDMYRGRYRSPPNGLERQEHQRQQRHAARVSRYHTICQLDNEGMSVAAIARRLNINRKTLYAEWQRGGPPEAKTRTVRPSDRVLTPEIPSLIERWRQGNVSGQQLWREIKAKGIVTLRWSAQRCKRTTTRSITWL